MSEIIEYELDGTKKEIDRFIDNLEADRYIKYVQIDKTASDIYTYISVTFDTHMIKSKLKCFTCKKEIIEAIIDLIGENWNVYDCYTVEDCIDTLIDGHYNSYFVFEWIDSYMEGVLTDKDYNDFLDRIAMYKKYGSNQPLKLERGLRNKGYLKY